MRSTILTGLVIFLIGCDPSAKKDPNQAMDDTARMRSPPVETSAAIQPVELTAADIPPEIKFKGKLKQALKWTDDLGENILITSTVGPYDDKEKNEYDEEGETTELHAIHYAKKQGPFAVIFTLKDQEKACPFDITADFISRSTTVTDLDKDGMAEVKLQYSLACRSDVSPSAMMLVMYENGISYKLKGTRWLPYSPDLKFTVTEKDVNLANLPPLKDETETMLRSFGRYENEKGFTSAPPEFLVYARKEWLKHVMEKMGE